MTKIPEAEKHCYKNYLSVIAILTTQYGFKYTGIGDNGEECFHKKNEGHDETAYVHPMFCSYHCHSKNLHPDFKSDFNNQKEQEIAFKELCVYLDRFSKKEELPLTKEILQAQLDLLEEQRIEIVKIATNTEISIDSKKVIPLIYKYLIECQSTVSFTMSKLK